jgi:hypothetical protein
VRHSGKQDADKAETSQQRNHQAIWDDSHRSAYAQNTTVAQEILLLWQFALI